MLIAIAGTTIPRSKLTSTRWCEFHRWHPKIGISTPWMEIFLAELREFPESHVTCLEKRRRNFFPVGTTEKIDNVSIECFTHDWVAEKMLLLYFAVSEIIRECRWGCYHNTNRTLIRRTFRPFSVRVSLDVDDKRFCYVSTTERSVNWNYLLNRLCSARYRTESELVLSPTIPATLENANCSLLSQNHFVSRSSRGSWKRSALALEA